MNGSPSMEGDVHVVPGGDHWRVEIHGSGVHCQYRTRATALSEGRQLAQIRGCELYVYDGEGRVASWELHRPDLTRL